MNSSIVSAGNCHEVDVSLSFTRTCMRPVSPTCIRNCTSSGRWSRSSASVWSCARAMPEVVEVSGGGGSRPTTFGATSSRLGIAPRRGALRASSIAKSTVDVRRIHSEGKAYMVAYIQGDQDRALHNAATGHATSMSSKVVAVRPQSRLSSRSQTSLKPTNVLRAQAMMPVRAR